MDGLIRYLAAYLPIAPGSQIPEEVVARGREALADHLNAAGADAYDKQVELFSVEVMPLVEKSVMLQTIDRKWMEYLTEMEQFREGVGLRAYGQRDPLVEYKDEAIEMVNERRDRMQ